MSKMAMANRNSASLAIIEESRKSTTRSKLMVSTTGGLYMKPIEKSRTVVDIQNYKSDVDTDAHIISLKELCSRLATDAEKGLSRRFADELLATNGPNCLTPPPGESMWKVFVRNLFGGFAALLWIGGILSLATFVTTIIQHDTDYDHLYMAVSLLSIVIITGTFAYFQEEKNIQVMESFKKMMPQYATVIREGFPMNILSEELVIGDLIEFKAGDRVPADIRLIECHNVKVDNSSLTGESELQNRSAVCTDNNPLESENLAFSSTMVVEGNGKGIVIATGDQTTIGKIAGLTSCVKNNTTPIRREINIFIKIITSVAFTIALLFAIISLIIGDTFMNSLIFFIALLVANVPEALLVTLTACLTLTAKRMSSKNCLVKNLESMETLGSTSVICSDKTGTLTQNKMTVMHVWFYNELFTSEMIKKRQQSDVWLFYVAILCSNAQYEKADANSDAKITGDASETGILKFLTDTLSMSYVMDIRSKNPKICEIPFNSTNKFQVSIHFNKDSGTYIAVMKGAPETILNRCNREQINWNDTSDQNVYTERKKTINRNILRLGNEGERVLAFCMCFLNPAHFPQNYQFNSETPNFPLDGYSLVGLMAMMDPPKLGVPDAVSKCKTAGIRVIMVTGDHPVTAAAIARKVGIFSPESITLYDIALKMDKSVTEITEDYEEKCNAKVVTGTELRSYSSIDLDNTLKKYYEIVFARTSPQQKLIIVEAVQRTGAIVAVTGDGVNDSPALKRADIGISMGISGSDVSKDAAKIILLDDNFATIVTGIEEGRLIFDNLKKSIAFVLTSNIPEVIPYLTFVVLGLPLPLTIIAILCINLATDLWPAISLAYEKPESDLMKRKPRNAKTDRLVNRRLIFMAYFQVGVTQCVAGFTSYFLMMLEHGFPPQKLIKIRDKWLSRHVNLEDIHGQQWVYEERRILERYAVTAYFVAIVTTQWTDLIVSKTRKLSVFQQGLGNWCLNFGLIFATAVSCMFCYTPIFTKVLYLEPISWKYWVIPLPFTLFIWVYDEVRKLFIRMFPGGLIERLTYY